MEAIAREPALPVEFTSCPGRSAMTSENPESSAFMVVYVTGAGALSLSSTQRSIASLLTVCDCRISGKVNSCLSAPLKHLDGGPWLTSRPGRFTPFTLGLPAWTFWRSLVKIGVEHRRRKQCALRNVGVIIHKTVTIVYDSNTLKTFK